MKMNILHIACTNGDMCNGVQVVVPQHVIAQCKYANVAFVNISNIKMDIPCTQFEYSEGFSVASLEAPFNKPDIVVFHECYRIQYIKIAKELRGMGVPYVIIPHGELSKDAQKKKYLKKKAANVLIFNSFINHAAAVQLLSEVEFGNTKFGKYKFVGTNGMNLPSCSKEQFSEEGLKLVYIGRLDVYHKGLDLMIKGIAECVDVLRSNRCTLDIYGPDILGRLDQVKALVRENNVEDIVCLHEPVFGKEKEEIILGADIFIQTSRFEGMPMGILEALSYGVPCLVTEGTTLAGLIKENGAGWACATDASEISDTIKKAVQQKESFLDISEKAKDVVRCNFEWSVIANKTVEKYTELLHRGK